MADETQTRDWCCSMCLYVNSSSVTACQTCGISEALLKTDDTLSVVTIETRNRNESTFHYSPQQVSLANLAIDASTWQCMACSCLNESIQNDNVIKPESTVNSKNNGNNSNNGKNSNDKSEMNDSVTTNSNVIKKRKLERCQTCGTRQFSLKQLQKPSYNKFYQNSENNDENMENNIFDYIDYCGIISASNSLLIHIGNKANNNDETENMDISDNEDEIATPKMENNKSENANNGNNNNNNNNNKNESKKEKMDGKLLKNSLVLGEFRTLNDFLLELSLLYLKFGNNIDIRYTYAVETTNKSKGKGKANADGNGKFGSNNSENNYNKSKNKNGKNGKNGGKEGQNTDSSFYEILMSLVWTHKEFADSQKLLNALIFVYKTVLQLYSINVGSSSMSGRNHNSNMNLNRSKNSRTKPILVISRHNNNNNNDNNQDGGGISGLAQGPPSMVHGSSEKSASPAPMGATMEKGRSSQAAQAAQAQAQAQSQQLSKQNILSIENFKKLQNLKRDKNKSAFKFARTQFDFARIIKEIIKNWVENYWGDDFQKNELLKSTLKEWLIVDCNKYLTNSIGSEGKPPDLFRDISSTAPNGRGNNNSNNNNGGAPLLRGASPRGGGGGGARNGHNNNNNNNNGFKMFVPPSRVGVGMSESMGNAGNGNSISGHGGSKAFRDAGAAPAGTYESEMLAMIDDFTYEYANSNMENSKNNKRKENDNDNNNNNNSNNEDSNSKREKQHINRLVRTLNLLNDEKLDTYLFIQQSESFIGDQITYLNSIAFEQIDAREWFVKDLDSDIYVHFTGIVNQLNGLSYWIRVIILSESDFYKRVELIEKMYKLADVFIRRNNFHSLFALFSAMQGEIGKLKECHDYIKQHNRGLVTKFNQHFDKFFTMSNNMANYTMRIKLVESTMPRQPCIPYLGKFKGDLVYTEEMCKSNWNIFLKNNKLNAKDENGEKLINFERYLHLGHKIRYIQSFQAIGYDDIKPVENILRYFKSMLEKHCIEKNYDFKKYKELALSLNKKDSFPLSSVLLRGGSENAGAR